MTDKDIEKMRTFFRVSNAIFDCVKKHDLCNKGNHDFVEKINTVWESGVPYPEYTDDFVCQNCGVIRENY
jgi:hypothetical protein